MQFVFITYEEKTLRKKIIAAVLSVIMVVSICIFPSSAANKDENGVPYLKLLFLVFQPTDTTG